LTVAASSHNVPGTKRNSQSPIVIAVAATLCAAALVLFAEQVALSARQSPTSSVRSVMAQTQVPAFAV